ncbi:MAG: type I glyceraldehyde-3-phosphate dehydrogenase, partial [Candidatus Heimdallarchaeota archaeon]|nr:type I glyceraldehyde-3-phosphate dehydrogenase [Candidatus Heimdallarchaeota archaeon]
SIRVPTPNVSLVDAIYTLKKETTVDEINNIFIEASKGKLKSILAVSTLPLVSIDYNGAPHSAIVDLPLTMCNKNQVKIVAWYDNESGYSNRMVDLALYVANK